MSSMDDFDVDSDRPYHLMGSTPKPETSPPELARVVQPAPLAGGGVFAPIFDLGFGATPAAGAQDLINSAAVILRDVEEKINQCVHRIFAGQMVTRAKCHGVINDCVQSYLNVVRDICGGKQDCITREMHRLTAFAWQTSAQFGCSDAPETQPYPPIGPPTYPQPPSYPQPTPPILPPPIERPPIVPPPFPPRPQPPREQPPDKTFPPRPPEYDKPFPPRPIASPPVTPPIGVEPPFPQCPDNAPLECWLGLPPAPPRIVPLAVGCQSGFTVAVDGDLMHVWSSPALNDRCPNVDEWIRGANQILQARGYGGGFAAWMQRDPGTTIQNILRVSGRKLLAPPPPIQQPPAPPGAPPAQCPTCCCCPCECKDKEPPEEKPEPEPPEEEEDGEWCCMKQVNGACYVKHKSNSPHSSTDAIVSCHASASEAQTACQKACADEPPSEPAPPDESAGIAALNWCDLDLADFVGTTQYVLPVPEDRAIEWMLGLDKPPAEIFRSLFRMIGTMIVAPGEINAEITKFIDSLPFVGRVVQIIRDTSCIDKTNFSLHFVRGAVGILEKWISDNFAEVGRPLGYWSNWRCPTIIPSPHDLATGFLAGSITHDQLMNLTKANGYCWAPWQQVVYGQRSKINPLELRDLRRRGHIDADEYAQKMREMGYVDSQDTDKIWKLSEVIPPYSDLVRMMVRDTEDAALVQQFGMDTDFDVKYAGQLKKWFADQGVPELAAKYLWRAHWSIPSPTQLYTMFHRLSRLPAGDAKFTDINMVKTALQQQDILPFWIDKLLAISYLPINRSDATQAFIHGVMNEAELKESYLVNGYDEPSADKMVAKTYQQRVRRYWRNPPVRAFIQGGLPEVDTRQFLASEGLDVPSIDIVIDRSKRLRRAASRKKCIDAIKRRFFVGEFDAGGATTELIQFGVDNDFALETVDFWRCELASKGKHFSVSQLCGMLERGLVTQAEFIARSRRLGWSNDDAIILAADCLARINIRATKAAEMQARKEESKKRQNEAALKRGIRDTAAAQRAEGRMLEAARKASERRTDMLLRAAEKMAEKLDLQVADMAREGKRIWDLLHFVNRINLDDALQAVVRSAEIFATDGGYSWEELAVDYSIGEQAIEGTINGSTAILE